MMQRSLSLARRAWAKFKRSARLIKTRLLHALHHPGLVHEARSFPRYQAAARRVAQRNSRWLRNHWFRPGETLPSHVEGHCFVCGQWTPFAVDSSVCSSWEGRAVPWWTNTLTCPGCRLVARMRATVQLFEERLAPARDAKIYITEQMTRLYRLLRERHPWLVGSEFLLDSTPRGSTNTSGIRCEDLTDLSFPDAQFDYLLSFDVLEHIPDYQAALRECARVLKVGGKLFCTAPFLGDERHTIRARVTADGTIEHLLPPEYHGDPINPDGVLSFRTFGVALLDDLKDAGFRDAAAWLYWSPELGYLGEDRVVFVATR